MLEDRGLHRAFLVASVLLLGLASRATGQNPLCPEDCIPDPVVVTHGVIPPGVDIDLYWESSEEGDATALKNLDGGTVACATCTPCTGVLYKNFDAGETGATLCYTPDGGGIWAATPEVEARVNARTNCDGPPQEINVALYMSGVNCNNPGGASTWSAEARLYCDCLEYVE